MVGSLHLVVRGHLYAGSRRLFSSLRRDASVKAEETESGKQRAESIKVPGNQDSLIVLHWANFV